MNHQKRKLTRFSKSLEFPQLQSMELPNTVAIQMQEVNWKTVLNVYKENIPAAYNVLDIEIEETSPIYDRDTKNKAEELDRLHAAMKENLVTV